MKATLSNGELKKIDECYIKINNKPIYMRMLPDISDSKSATYTDETGMGRSMPFKSYANSDNRTINWTVHYVVTKKEDVDEFIKEIRYFQSAVYPRESFSPYAPPWICSLRCGKLLKNQDLIFAVLKNYSIKYDTSVPWDEDTLLPYKFDIDLQFDVVHDQSKLPGAEKILGGG
jgi:hypothetical protein